MKLHCAFNRKSKSKSNKYYQQTKEKKTPEKPMLKSDNEISGILEYLINVYIHFFKTYKCTKQNYLNKQFG